MYIPRVGLLEDSSGVPISLPEMGIEPSNNTFKKWLTLKLGLKNNHHRVKFQKFKNCWYPPYGKIEPIQDGGPNKNRLASNCLGLK